MSEEEEIKNAILTIMKDGEYLSPQTQFAHEFYEKF